MDLALQATTEKLARATRLLALVSGPPLEATTVRHAEVLLLQPELVMVVVITSTGGVSKRMFDFAEPVDPGIAAWAREYLNERLAGVRLGSRMLRDRLDDPGFTTREREFMQAIAPVFTDLLSDSDRLFVGGAAGLLDDVRADELAAHRQVLALLEQRTAVIELLNHELAPNRPFVRVERSSTTRRCTTSPWLAPPTASPTGCSGPSASSAPCAWTTRPRSTRCEAQRSRSRAS